MRASPHCPNGHDLAIVGVYHRPQKSGYVARVCKECSKERGRENYSKTHIRIGRSEGNRRRFEKWRQERLSNPQKQCSLCKEWKLRDDFQTQNKTYDGRSTWCRPCAAKHNRERHRNHLAQLRNKVLDKFGRVCKHCGFTDVRALQVDHVYGNGLADKGRGAKFYLKVLADVSGNFQLLCANCNWIKRHENNELPKRVD